MSQLRRCAVALSLSLLAGSASGQVRAVACYRTATGPIVEGSVADARAQCAQAELPTQIAYAPPFVDLESELLTWWQQGDAFADPPAASTLAVVVNGGSAYAVPLDPGRRVQVVRFRFSDFVVPPHGTAIQVRSGDAVWHVRWRASTRLLACVGAPLGPIDGSQVVGALTTSALAPPHPACTPLTDTAPPTKVLRPGRKAEAVHVHLVRDGGLVGASEPEWRALTDVSVLDPAGDPLASGYGAMGGGLEALLDDVGSLPHGTRLTVRAKYDGKDRSYALRLDRPAMLYGKQGLWVPLALFGTTFQKSETGATLTALPLGLAWGGRYNVHERFYLGGSVMTNYLIHKKVTTAGVETADYSLESLSFGALVDLNNWAYVGGVYGTSFQSGVKDPGFMFVLGVAPGGLELVKGRQ